jgi:hypothetical protein
MVLNPFVALEECTLGVWPSPTFVVAYDVIADADNFIWFKAGF